MEIVFKHTYELTNQERDVLSVQQLFRDAQYPLSSFVVTAPYGYGTLVINADHPQKKRIAEIALTLLTINHWDDLTADGVEGIDLEEEFYQIAGDVADVAHKILIECILKVWRKRDEEKARNEAKEFYVLNVDHPGREWINRGDLYWYWDQFKVLNDFPTFSLRDRTEKALEDLFLMGYEAGRTGKTFNPCPEE